MLIDTHIHVGQFYNLYFAPSTIHKLMEQIGVVYYAVSSTTQCEENYTKVLAEFEELIRLDGTKVLPIMWITPNALQGNIAWYLESDINWRMLKIHPFLNQTEWNPQGTLFNEVLDISREMHLPLLIHSGNEECCRADLFESAISKNSDITFVLAHGRPIKDSLRIAQKYDNAFIDSSFMPLEHMKMFVEKNLAEKLFWGTDFCIPQYFDHTMNMVSFYHNKLHAFSTICTQEQFEKVTFKNAMSLFHLIENV